MFFIRSKKAPDTLSDIVLLKEPWTRCKVYGVYLNKKTIEKCWFYKKTDYFSIFISLLLFHLTSNIICDIILKTGVCHFVTYRYGKPICWIFQKRIILILLSEYIYKIWFENPMWITNGYRFYILLLYEIRSDIEFLYSTKSNVDIDNITTGILKKEILWKGQLIYKVKIYRVIVLSFHMK